MWELVELGYNSRIMSTKIVKEGYRQIARAYLTERQKLKTAKYINELMPLLPKGASILDAGCGAGVPVDDVLIANGFFVTGIDFSPEQIDLARKLCRGGDFVVRDMQELKEGDYQVDAVICLYTMFHIPRMKQQEIIRIMCSYLPVGGYFLVTLGDRPFEGMHTMLGAPMWSSQFNQEKNRAMVKKAGMQILIDEINTSGSERHQVIFAIKK